MARSQPKLPITPLPHLAMDYARLRSEGLRLLGELGGEQWSDFNSHDPGITILEQLCYAITDLAYRIEFSIPDLLAGEGEDPHASLPSAATMLGCRPVTITDLRKLAKDAGGGSNAWVEDAVPACPFFHHADSAELHLRPDPSAVEAGAVPLHGLHRVWLPSGDDGSEATRQRAVARLHRERPLCEDLAVEVLRSQPIWLDASIEVTGGVGAQQILDEIVANIEAYLAPRVDFESLPEASARCGGASEAVFDGPTLERGFLSDHNLARSKRRREVYASDLIHVINDVTSVRAVRRLTIATSARGTAERWTVSVADDGVPTLAAGSSLTLLRDGLPLPLDANAITQALARQAQLGDDPVLPADQRDLSVTPGRERKLARYHSILTHFPLSYGVGRFGLPPSASPARHGQARQLQAYVLMFDQLLANCFAQLAHARELFSHFGETPRTYFSQVVEDPVIDLDVLRSERQPGDHARWLDEAVVSTAVDELGSLDRRARFLAHLLARYAEELDEVDTGSEAAASERTLADIRRKLAFLRAYPRISANRGTGCDLFATDSVAGLADRIRLELGLPRDTHPSFEIVEHLLLRPIAEDRGQLGDEGEELVPLLAGVDRSDPYSRQLAVVFREPSHRDEVARETFERLVERVVIEHTPAHLGVTLHWLGDTTRGKNKGKHWSVFIRDHRAFRAALAAYRELGLLGSAATAEQRQLAQLRLRDSRDRVIEHLGLGATYPLRDVPVPDLLIVPADTEAKIPLGFSQAGVTYRLCDYRSGAAINDAKGKPYQVVGTGGPIELVTPVVLEDVTYSILALEPTGNFPAIGERHAWLHTKVTLKEGVDTTLDSHIDKPVLDRSIDNPKSTDARICYHGDEVEVRVHLSQEGVLYDLVDNDDPERVLSQAEVVGDTNTITLRSAAMVEDVDLRVRARKHLEEEESEGVTREALLDIVLPLRVRANVDLEVVAAESVIGFGSGARVRVRKSQKSARYRVWTRDVFDRDYHFDNPPTSATFNVKIGSGNKARVVRVVQPQRQSVWKQPPRFVQIDSWRKGNGTTLSFNLAKVEHDQAFVVQAVKTHELGPLDESSRGTINSNVQLKQACAVLVQPDPTPSLRLRVRDDDDAPTVGLEGGQPGVYYSLAEINGRPGYVHQRDDDDVRFNKGVGQLRVEVDLALAREPETSAQDPATQAPLGAGLDLDQSPAGAAWTLTARKAMTRLELRLEGRAEVGPALTIRVEPAQVEPGASATVTVEASEAGKRYELLDGNGQAIGEAVEGSGKALVLTTGAVAQRTTYTLRITPIEAEPIVVERLVPVIVELADPG